VFESTGEVRRLAPIPEKWIELSIDELRLLCHQAARTAYRAANKTPPASTPPIQS
jgi:hypothetical protein